jgi:hypothetical protein
MVPANDNTPPSRQPDGTPPWEWLMAWLCVPVLTMTAVLAAVAWYRL